MATPGQVEQALLNRIQKDNPGKFKKTIWKDVTFGKYYDNDDELINIVVYETTEGVVNEEGRTLPSMVWRKLIDMIGPETTPKSALSKMWLATLGAQPMKDEEEPPTLERRRKPPVLKRPK